MQTAIEADVDDSFGRALLRRRHDDDRPGEPQAPPVADGG
jgi:hypothetical protein